jgi:hypothetical protein
MYVVYCLRQLQTFVECKICLCEYANKSANSGKSTTVCTACQITSNIISTVMQNTRAKISFSVSKRYFLLLIPTVFDWCFSSITLLQYKKSSFFLEITLSYPMLFCRISVLQRFTHASSSWITRRWDSLLLMETRTWCCICTNPSHGRALGV